MESIKELSFSLAISNIDYEYLQMSECFLKFAQNNPQVEEQKVTGVNSIITYNEKYNSYFFNVLGNTIPIKERLKELKFKYFNGVWGKNIKYISDSDKTKLRDMGVPIENLAAKQIELSGEAEKEVAEKPAEISTVEPKTEEPVQKTEEDKKIDEKMEQMQHGVDIAMAKTGPDRVKDLMGFVDRMIEIVSNMTDAAAQSSMVKDFLAFSSKFHQYSFHNQILIWVQNRNSTYVNGHKKWMELGRMVTNWDHPIHILAPRFKKVEEQTESGPKEENKLVGFGTVSVYDISDTISIPNYEQQMGKKPFEPAKWRQDPNEELEEINVLVNAIKDFARENNIAIETVEMIEEKGGVSMGGKIQLNNTFKGINLFSTLVHETSHEILHHQTLDSKQKATGTRQEFEIDAETVAYIVLKYFGFETTDTPNYLALWKATATDIRNRRDNINKATKIIIQNIEKYVSQSIAKYQTEMPEEIEGETGEVEELNVESPPMRRFFQNNIKNKKESNMKIKLSKTQWEQVGETAGWMKEAQAAAPAAAQQPKQMQIFNANYQNLMRTLNSLRPDIQNKASAAFSNTFNSLKDILGDPDSWVSL